MAVVVKTTLIGLGVGAVGGLVVGAVMQKFSKKDPKKLAVPASSLPNFGFVPKKFKQDPNPNKQSQTPESAKVPEGAAGSQCASGAAGPQGASGAPQAGPSPAPNNTAPLGPQPPKVILELAKFEESPKELFELLCKTSRKVQENAALLKNQNIAGKQLATIGFKNCQYHTRAGQLLLEFQKKVLSGLSPFLQRQMREDLSMAQNWFDSQNHNTKMEIHRRIL